PDSRPPTSAEVQNSHQAERSEPRGARGPRRAGLTAAPLGVVRDGQRVARVARLARLRLLERTAELIDRRVGRRVAAGVIAAEHAIAVGIGVGIATTTDAH